MAHIQALTLVTVTRNAKDFAGNGQVRRVLVEAAWRYRHRPAVGRNLRQRREAQLKAICALADRAQRRLYRRFHRLVLGYGKPSTKVVVAIAREPTSFLWAALSVYPIPRRQRARELT